MLNLQTIFVFMYFPCSLEPTAAQKIAKDLHNTQYTKYGSDKVMEVIMESVHGICKRL